MPLYFFIPGVIFTQLTKSSKFGLIQVFSGHSKKHSPLYT